MDGIRKATSGTFCAKIRDIFILVGPMIAQADTMKCAGWAEVASDGIGVKRDENNVPQAAWYDGEFDNCGFIVNLFVE